MIVTLDDKPLPVSSRVTLQQGSPAQLSIQIPATDPEAMGLVAAADGQVHVLRWLDDAGKVVIEAHAKLQWRITTDRRNVAQQDMLELYGQAWGRPPNYGQFWVTE